MSEKYKLILFQFSFILVALLIIELSLRSFDYQPGDLRPNWANFKPVDSLYIIPDFTTNSEGILTANTAYWAQKETYVNSLGYRNAEFNKLDSAKKKILFIGDSFTWGLSAKPVSDSCFVDIIRNETNFEIINLGIPAADPVQYAALAKKYIPILQPDYLIIVFFAGNDILLHDRKIVPGEPFYFFTNAGAILADIDGRHFKTPQAAYHYLVNEKFFINNPITLTEKVIAKSALATRLYFGWQRLKEKLEYEKAVKNSITTIRYLTKIEQLASAFQVPIKFVWIPEIKEADMPPTRVSKRYKSLFSDKNLMNHWLIFGNNTANFNPYPDGHFNNTGHRCFADSLKAFLENAPELK